MSSDIKIKVQSFGRFLSNMVMPNIGAFIAWGIITALFIPTGWLPNETLAKLVGPMITYLLPLLLPPWALSSAQTCRCSSVL